MDALRREIHGEGLDETSRVAAFEVVYVERRCVVEGDVRCEGAMKMMESAVGVVGWVQAWAARK